MKKTAKLILAIVLLVLVYAYFMLYPKFDIVSGFSSKSIASHYFLAKRSASLTEKEDNNVPSMSLATNVVDQNNQFVSSSVFGLFKKRRAKYKDGLGAILIPNGKENKSINIPKPNRIQPKINKAYPFGNLKPIDTIFGNIDYKKIARAIDFAFKSEHKTRSVLILYKGYLVTERYVDNFDKNSLILGWSMTKSVTSTILGVLEKQKKINLEQRNLFNTWKNDDRKNISLKNLLNMNSGLEWLENYNKICDVTSMLFLEPKMSTTQLNKSFVGKSNKTWNYSSGTTNLLSEFIRNQFQTHQEYLDFWYKEFIDKIGMYSMLIETDYSGTYVGSSYGWATTRDWAKYGQFYLQNGIWNGEQLIHKSWVDFSRKPTNNSNGEYGGHFWLNAGGYFKDAPKDMYAANGYQGQRIFILPSQDLVIVRTGLAGSTIFNMNLFLKGVLESF
ncbi:MAG: beta-lactamase family protein [Flavobacteriaceae bacterium]|nr:beta-lactamase family protein [Flavobacteriaceae bacterium]